ncbi:MAG: TetR family transcriptional regulator [Rhodovulum sulfidophilum]|uniref:TetR family transcriptional regulator n=1 Tax=Rhodovulum sulfidophilum TaxID=35806 RepID=A0A2W5NCC7_RHOSU|nr:MAG: TetR family transcriptional regulator [Rhodovulum sulfidophilum]
MRQPDPQPAVHAPREPRTRGPSPEKTAHTRSVILAAAMAEFLEQGFAATTMTRVAERAGLAKGTPYRYFPTKEALFLDLMRESVTDPLRAANEQPIGPDESVRGYCQRALLPVMAVIEETGRATIARLALTESRAFPELTAAYRREVYLPFLAYLERIAREAVVRGELAPELADHAAYLLAAPLWIGLVHNGVFRPDAPVPIGTLFERQLDLVFGPGKPRAAGRDAIPHGPAGIGAA